MQYSNPALFTSAPQPNRLGSQHTSSFPYTQRIQHNVLPPVMNNYNSLSSEPAALHLMKQDLFKKSEIPFDGEPSRFNSWLALLKNRVIGIQLSSIDMMSILAANTTGEPFNIVQCYLSALADNPEETLEKIWQALHNQFGSPVQICASLKRKLELFPIIKAPNIN